MLYKLYLYTYPVHWAMLEIGLFVLLQVVQFLRLFVGAKGNKTENAGITFFFIFLTILTTLGAVYFLQLQTYVVIGEALLALAVLVLGLLELLLGFIALVEFWRID